jgi:hypothetical protein
MYGPMSRSIVDRKHILPEEREGEGTGKEKEKDNQSGR